MTKSILYITFIVKEITILETLLTMVINKYYRIVLSTDPSVYIIKVFNIYSVAHVLIHPQNGTPTGTSFLWIIQLFWYDINRYVIYLIIIARDSIVVIFFLDEMRFNKP